MVYLDTNKKGALIEYFLFLFAFLILIIGYILSGIAVSVETSDLGGDDLKASSPEALALSYPLHFVKVFLLMPLNEEEKSKLNSEQLSMLRGKEIIRVQDFLEISTEDDLALLSELRKRYFSSVNEKRLGKNAPSYSLYERYVAYRFTTSGELFPSGLLFIDYNAPDQSFMSIQKEKNAFVLLKTIKGDFITIYFAKEGSFEEVNS